MKKQRETSLLFILAVFLICGCGVSGAEQEKEKIDDIHGVWVLEQIVYDSGNNVDAPDEPIYWFELKEDSLFAEQDWHYSLTGQSNCNSCFGYYDFDEESRSISISFICDRLICGIATEFATTVATSYKYSFQNGNLLLFFDSVSQNKGRLILRPEE